MQFGSLGMRVTSNASMVESIAFNSPAQADADVMRRAKALKLQQAHAQFITWLQIKQPDAYNLLRSMRRELVSPGLPLSGLGQDESATSMVTNAVETTQSFFKDVLPSYFQFRAQKDLIQVNLERVKQGLPPIDSETLAPGLTVGVSSGTRTLAYVAVGALAVLGFVHAFKRR
jgi:hypothetical protein